VCRLSACSTIDHRIRTANHGMNTDQHVKDGADSTNGGLGGLLWRSFIGFIVGGSPPKERQLSGD